MGTILGSAVFIAAAFVPASVPHPSLVLFLWVVGGLLSVAGALCFAELGGMFPRAGGIYHYLKETYGPVWGFLFGWTSFLVIQCGALAYLGVAFAEYLGAFVPAVAWTTTVFTLPVGSHAWTVSSVQVTAAATIAVFTAVNYVGVKQGAGLQNALTVVKLGSLFGIIGFGVFGPSPVTPDWTAPLPDGRLVPAMGVALIGIYGSYDGWYQAVFSAGEMRRPERDLPRGMILGTVTMVIAYALVNFVYLKALPIDVMAGSTRVGEAAASALFGPVGGRLLAGAVVVSVLGCLATCILTAARIYQPMAEDGLFFRSLARIHPRYRTPHTSLVAQGLWGAALALTGTYEQLLNYVVFAVFVLHTLTGAAVLVLRYRRPLHDRPYRVWGYPWVPLVFTGSSAAFVVNTLIERPQESLFGLGLMIAGLPAYAWWRRAHRLRLQTEERRIPIVSA